MYNPYLSDYVVATFKGFTSTSLKSYLDVWFKMGIKHPGLYIEATITNCLGFFFPDYYVSGNSYLYMYYSAQFAEKISYTPFNKFDNLKEIYYDYCLNFGKLPILYFLCSTGIQIWLSFYLFLYSFMYCKKYILGTLPQFVLLLVCIASPTFVHNGARYALPILFVNIFLFCVIKCTKKIEK